MEIANTDTIRLHISNSPSESTVPVIRFNSRGKRQLVFHCNGNNKLVFRSNTYLGVDDYNNLSNKPKINNVTLTGNKSHSDLGIQPTLISGTNIKTINNQSLLGSGNINGGLIDDVTVNGESVVANRVAAVTVPTKTSDIINDSGFLTEHQSLSAYRTSANQDIIDNAIRADIPTKTSQLTNDSGFLTEHQSLANYSTTTQMNTAIANHHDSTKYDASNPSGYITSSAITGKENTSNKVTSINSASTNTQYPSAKCVYDIVGNIEAALDAIRGV